MVEDADSFVIPNCRWTRLPYRFSILSETSPRFAQIELREVTKVNVATRNCFISPVEYLLLPIQILHLLRSILAAVIRLFFNQFLSRNSVKRNNSPISVSADHGAVPDILRN